MGHDDSNTRKNTEASIDEIASINPADQSTVESAGADGSNLLSDTDLREGGLKPIIAWTRSEKSKKQNTQKSYRKKLARSGMKQINVLVPDNESCRAAIKSIALGLTQNVLQAEDVMRFASNRSARRPTATSLPSVLFKSFLNLLDFRRDITRI